jgi:DNA-binding PadR family transcriptional regulator
VAKTVGVPRGLLRFLVLKMLSEKPMSGAEIVEQIEKQTGGRWKPSPGSIYPLLAWMLNKGFTKGLPKGEEGFKRYSFTVKGSKFLEKQIELGQDFLNKMEFLLPMFIGGLQFGSSKEKLRGAIEPARQLISAFLAIRHNLNGLSQKDSDEIAQALNECSEKLEKIARRLRDEGKT